jgi:hypothetical protein
LNYECKKYNASKLYAELLERNDWESVLIIYSQDNFDKEYTEEQRTYRVKKCNVEPYTFGIPKVIGDCIDGTDNYVRLDAQDWEMESYKFEDK